jgi:hypothetical protein
MHLLARLLISLSVFFFFLARCISHVFQLCWHSADDYRLFCGDLGNEVNDDVLSKAFSRFPTFNMARVSIFIIIFLKISFYFFSSHLISKCLFGVNFLLFVFRFSFEVLRAVNVLCIR